MNKVKLGEIGGLEIFERVRWDEGIAAVVGLRIDVDAGDVEIRLAAGSRVEPPAPAVEVNAPSS